jgi:type IV fimbrial biogenesis protein FimT
MHRARTSGFTLVELMVTIAIVAILLAVGLPSFQTSLRSNRVATTTNEMLASLSLARTEAIRSTQSSLVCARDGAVCGDDWNQGWLVMTDTDGDETYETLVKAVDAHPNLRVSMELDGAADDSVVFDRKGRTTDAAGTDRLVEISPDDDDALAAHFRCMDISPVGQVTTRPEACG